MLPPLISSRFKTARFKLSVGTLLVVNHLQKSMRVGLSKAPQNYPRSWVVVCLTV